MLTLRQHRLDVRESFRPSLGRCEGMWLRRRRRCPAPPATYPTKTARRGFRRAFNEARVWTTTERVRSACVGKTPPPPLKLDAHLFQVAIETLGEALSRGWRVTARCAHGRRDGMKSIKEASIAPNSTWRRWYGHAGEASRSRAWKRGCVARCAARDVRLIFTVPRGAQTVRGARSGPK